MKRALAVVSLIALIATAGAIYQYREGRECRQAMEKNYQRAFIELVDNVGNIDVILNKALVTNDYLQLAELSEKLWTETALAKSSLGQLPIASTELDKTSSFITQISDYVHTLTQKLLKGETVTDEERSQMTTLAKYSDSLNKDLKEMENQFMDGTLELSENQMRTAFADTPVTNINESLGKIEKSFEDYPTIIYDGPFSEHILNRKSEILNHPHVTREQALKIATDFTGADLEFSEETKGNIPSYIFSSKDNSICAEVSKNGGKVVMVTDNCQVKNPEITINQASAIAADFLRSKGYANMKETGYLLEGNLVNFAFAYTVSDYRVYSDLIKVKVSLHDGKICGFESNGYLFNHKLRTPPPPVISEENVLAALNPNLKIRKVSKACIPRDNGTESWCYEVKAVFNDKIFLVYVNTQTGNEEEILIYIEDTNGSMTI